MLGMVLEELGDSALEHSSLRSVVVGGSPIPRVMLADARRRIGDVFFPFYAMAESYSSGMVLRREEQFTEGSEVQLRHLFSAGKPMAMIDVRVVGEGGRDVPHDNQAAGEIWMRGDNISQAYFRMPEETVLVREGEWLKTGDIAVVDEQGFVTIIDRIKDIIITGGINVYSREVEEALHAHPAVAAAAVIGVPHPRWGEAIHAVVVLRPGAGASEQELMEFAAGRLAAYKKPRSLELVEERPDRDRQGAQTGPAGAVLRSARVNIKDEMGDQEFRERARRWLGDSVATLPPRPDRDDWPARRAYDCHWQRRCEYDDGFAGLGVPERYGGHEATLMEQLVYLEERGRAGAPPYGCNLIGVTHAGPTILSQGTEEQRLTLIPHLRGEEIWCQGFSETEAGSDLAALRCRAVARGDEYVISGHKIWSTHAAVADRCELLVRTELERRHRGSRIWHARWVSRESPYDRSARSLGNGSSPKSSFDDVHCPPTLASVEENDGWRVAMVTFSHERGTTFVYDLIAARVKLGRLAELSRKKFRAARHGMGR